MASNELVTKVCSRCGEARPITVYTRQKLGKEGRRSYCNICANEYNRSRRTPERTRRHNLKAKYGITPEEWVLLSAEGCGICGTHDNLVVDHDHTNGKVRGALCQTHNKAVGMLGDSAEGLERALRYLERASGDG